MGCFNSTVIAASADKVFETLNNFHDLSWSKNVITKLDVIGDKNGHEIGAKRVLNDAFHETLQSVDLVNRSFTYSIFTEKTTFCCWNICNIYFFVFE